MPPAPPQHPSEQVLRDYGLGKLDAAAAEAAHRHLEGCESCRRRVSEQSADSFLDRLREQRPEASRGGGPPSAEELPPGLADHPDYEVRKELGRGGMGVVYLAHNRLMGRDEVLKVMSADLATRAGVSDRFFREIRAVARLRHPNIVAAYSAVRLGDSLAFAMEYVPGLDLARMVKIKGPLPVAHACRFAHQAALGLQHAHEAGLIHRDVKPSNLILSHDGDRATVKVLDFGLTKGAGEKVDGALTQSGQALGTPDYIAPEQILDAAAADIRSDVYSLGATLFFLLAGRPPFRAKSLYDLYQAHISRLPDPMDQVRPDVPAELAALVAKMMAKDPDARFQTPKEVAQALAPFFKGRNASDRTSAGVDRARVASTIGEAQVSIPATRGPAPGGTAASNIPAPPLPDEPPSAEVETSGGSRRGLMATAGVGALLGAFAIAWLLGVFRAKTSEGTLVLRNLPEGAEVSIDGERFAFTWPGLDQPLEIRAVPGEKRLEVTKGGFTAFATDLSLKPEGREEVSIRLEPLAGAPATSSAAPGDLLKVGSVWKGEQLVEKPSPRRVEMALKIESRDGDEFRGTVDFMNGFTAEARGTISTGGAIEWGGARVLTWPSDAAEDKKAMVLEALPRYKVAGTVSVADRAIQATLNHPGHPSGGDVSGAVRLQLSDEGEAARAAGPTSDAAPGDVLKVGSVWKGEHVLERPTSRRLDMTLKIDSRDGEGFGGVVTFTKGWSAAVLGTISGDGAIRWSYTRIISWGTDATEARKKQGRPDLDQYRATGWLSVADRTIRCGFERPGPAEGEKAGGTIRLELSEGGG